MKLPKSYALMVLALLFACGLATRAADEWLPASAEKLPRWHGFNLLNKFNLNQDRPFDEKDFRTVHDLGFNFVRLPMDYRIWIANGHKLDRRMVELLQRYQRHLL